MSVLVSVPTSSAFSFEPSEKLTSISSASAITWLLVTTMPLLGIDDEAGAERLHLLRPPPVAALPVLEEVVEEILERRAFRQLRHRHRSGPSVPLTFCEVEMLTTASSRPSARSATDAGPCALHRRRRRRTGSGQRRSGAGEQALRVAGDRARLAAAAAQKTVSDVMRAGSRCLQETCASATYGASRHVGKKYGAFAA